jgi:hypothetical protein
LSGVRTVSISLAVLGATAGLQAAIFALTGSVDLLDLVHNFGVVIEWKANRFARGQLE